MLRHHRNWNSYYFCRLAHRRPHLIRLDTAHDLAHVATVVHSVLDRIGEHRSVVNAVVEHRSDRLRPAKQISDHKTSTTDQVLALMTLPVCLKLLYLLPRCECLDLLADRSLRLFRLLWLFWLSHD